MLDIIQGQLDKLLAVKLLYKLRVAERGIYNVNVFTELPSRKSWPNFDARCRVYLPSHNARMLRYINQLSLVVVTYNCGAYYIEFPPQHCKNEEFFVVCTSMNIRLSFFLVTWNEEFSFSIFPPINFILKAGKEISTQKRITFFEHF